MRRTEPVTPAPRRTPSEVRRGNAPSGPVWHRSSHSMGNGGNCVEVALVRSPQVLVRDSKDPRGPRLRFARRAWRDFLGGVTG
ncbi:DUF397 domain-containing protein [Streptomyces sp. NPDC058739]|uniref:DUF397 domain-containing protein n=1 Tax=Streptomyces sp. NPDC058739 TaxID=3346618 RepID=UPI0036BF8934